MADDLVQSVLRYTELQPGKSPFVTAIPGLTVLRSDHPKPLSHMILKPALCITLQGAKWTAFGERRFDYGAGQALVVGVEMPAVGQVTVASPAKPYLGLVVELDLGVMREVVESLDSAPVAVESVEAHASKAVAIRIVDLFMVSSKHGRDAPTGETARSPRHASLRHSPFGVALALCPNLVEQSPGATDNCFTNRYPRLDREGHGTPESGRHDASGNS